MVIPPRFAQVMHEIYPEQASAWLTGLPERLADLEQRWSIQIGPPFPNLSYHYVAPARRADGTPVVLKLGVPNPGLTASIEALRWLDGRGVAQLLESDPEQGTLLIERLEPGRPLTALDDDDRATAIAAQVMQRLWRPLPARHSFDTAADRAAELGGLRARFAGGTGPLPAALVAQAEGLFRDLLASSAAPVLLHGDLHHDNILSARRWPWLAIDPQGVAGEPCFEVGCLMRNPRPQPARILARRADILSEQLGFDRRRILAWSLAISVLSAWWSVEDHEQDWEDAIAMAEAMAQLI